MSISQVRDNPLTVRAGATATISAASNLAFSDTDYSDASITYTITTAPTHGTLLKNGSPTSSFTQDDLDNNRITYSETAPSASPTSDSFFFQVSDPGGNQTGTNLFQINITAGQLTESAPGSLTGFAGLAAAIKGVQLADTHNDTYTVTVTANSGILATNSGSGSGNSLSITGTLGQVNTALAFLSYQGNASGHDTVTITATDRTDHASATTSIGVTVKPPSSFTTIDDPLATDQNGSTARSINNAGQIVGAYFTGATNSYHGFQDSAGTFTTIDDPVSGSTVGVPSPSSTFLQNINDAGTITGYAEGAISSGTRFFGKGDIGLTVSGGSLQNFWVSDSNGTIATFSGNSMPSSQLFFEGINNSDQIVGYYNSASPFQPTPPAYIGFIYSNGTTQQIGPAGTQPFGINDAGQVVGQLGSHGFLYNNGNFSLIDDPSGASTVARDINNNGEVVGYFQSASDGGTHGFAYDPASGQWTTIDVPGATATFVYGENDLNQIVGSYTDANNVTHGFVGTIPPPLPAIAGNVDEWILFNGKWEASAQPGSHPAGSHVAAVGDFNNDGTSDILWQNVNTGGVDLWKISNGAWAGSVDLGTHPGGYQIAGAGDFNNDGTSDVLWFNASTGATDIWELSNGQWAASVSPGSHPTGYQVAGIGDFNHDGTSDILWFNPTTGNVDEWNIVNGQWAGSNNLGSHPGSGWQIGGVGDFNNDGASDIFWFNPSSGQTDIWELSNGHWAASVSPGSHPTGYQVAGIGDFNGDGTSDVLWFNPTTRDTDEWVISNSHWAGSIDLGTHPGSATIAGVGDFNGSLMSDILWHQFV